MLAQAATAGTPPVKACRQRDEPDHHLGIRDDANGNVTSFTDFQASYDGDSRTVSYTSGGTTSTIR